MIESSLDVVCFGLLLINDLYVLHRFHLIVSFVKEKKQPLWSHR